jgi:hypothetical protein
MDWFVTLQEDSDIEGEIEVMVIGPFLTDGTATAWLQQQLDKGLPAACHRSGVRVTRRILPDDFPPKDLKD